MQFGFCYSFAQNPGATLTESLTDGSERGQIFTGVSFSTLILFLSISLLLLTSYLSAFVFLRWSLKFIFLMAQLDKYSLLLYISAANRLRSNNRSIRSS